MGRALRRDPRRLGRAAREGALAQEAVVHAVKDLLSSDFKKAQQERETSLITRFFYPKYGPGQMWEIVAARGHEGRRRDPLSASRRRGVHRGRPRTRGRGRGRGDGRQRARVACDYFFSTMPVKELVKQTSPAPPAPVREVAEGLRVSRLPHRRAAAEEAPRAGEGAPSRPTSRGATTGSTCRTAACRWGASRCSTTGARTWWPTATNTVWIGLEYFVNEGDELWRMADDDLVEARHERAGAHRLHQARRRARRLRAADAEGVSRRTSGRTIDSTSCASGRRDAEPVPRRPQRHAPVQQPGPQHAHRDDGGGQHRRGAHRPLATCGT